MVTQMCPLGGHGPVGSPNGSHGRHKTALEPDAAGKQPSAAAAAGGSPAVVRQLVWNRAAPQTSVTL